jgi:hypothetical protein
MLSRSHPGLDEGIATRWVALVRRTILDQGILANNRNIIIINVGNDTRERYFCNHSRFMTSINIVRANFWHRTQLAIMSTKPRGMSKGCRCLCSSACHLGQIIPRAVTWASLPSAIFETSANSLLRSRALTLQQMILLCVFILGVSPRARKIASIGRASTGCR